MKGNITLDNNPLVSIITPCYNGETFVHRFLESVLLQAYPNIELIFINDGSNDNTEEIVFSYKYQFLNRGIELIYIYQENKGQAAALNQGLKIFKGDYLTWPDSDDILHSDNILKKVQYLENNKDCGMVICQTQCVDENNINRDLGVLQRKRPQDNDNLFFDLVIEKNVYFAPGGYMVRSIAFLDVLPDRHIYESRIGQNWQMLLPIAYKYKCGYINEILYYYVVKSSSHSHKEIGRKELIDKAYKHEETLKTIIYQMNIPENEYIQDIIRIKYLKKRLKLAYIYKDKMLLNSEFEALQKYKSISNIDKVYYYCGKYKVFDMIYKTILLPVKVFSMVRRKIF